MISRAHRCVFVHIPKCAGQSVEQAFLDDLGLDWADRAPLLLGRNPRPGQGPPRLAHLSAQDYVVLGHLTAQDWAAYFTFAVIRHPYARALSLFNYLAPTQTLAGFVHDWLPAQFALAPDYARPGHANPGQYHFVRPQVDFVTNGAGEVLVDRLFRFETLARHWPELRARTGLTTALGHRNRSPATARLRDLTLRDRARLAELYAADFAAFGYRRGVPGLGARLLRRSQ